MLYSAGKLPVNIPAGDEQELPAAHLEYHQVQPVKGQDFLHEEDNLSDARCTTMEADSAFHLDIEQIECLGCRCEEDYNDLKPSARVPGAEEDGPGDWLILGGFQTEYIGPSKVRSRVVPPDVEAGQEECPRSYH